jgi:hypothetical protein
MRLATLEPKSKETIHSDIALNLKKDDPNTQTYCPWCYKRVYPKEAGFFQHYPKYGGGCPLGISLHSAAKNMLTNLAEYFLEQEGVTITCGKTFTNGKTMFTAHAVIHMEGLGSFVVKCQSRSMRKNLKDDTNLEWQEETQTYNDNGHAVLWLWHTGYLGLKPSHRFNRTLNAVDGKGIKVRPEVLKCFDNAGERLYGFDNDCRLQEIGLEYLGKIVKPVIEREKMFELENLTKDSLRISTVGPNSYKVVTTEIPSHSDK